MLDLVGNAHENFRFDLRLRPGVGGGTRAELRRAVEEGFPRLPSGCTIQLEEQARDVVLDNLKRALGHWNALAEDLDEGMSLGDFLRRTELAPEDLYREGRTFCLLRKVAGLVDEAPDGALARALPRLLHVDDLDRITTWWAWLDEGAPPAPDPASPEQRMLFAALGQERRPLAELGDFLRELWAEPELRDELRQLLGVLDDRRRHLTRPVHGLPLRVHAHYTRAEVSAALGLVTGQGKLLATQAGVYKCDPHRCDLFFVTLEKDERDFTPTIRYEDFPISPTPFHWESQSRTREDSETGQRYQKPPPGWRHFLFVRRTKRDERGITSPFVFLGPVDYVRHEGERPMRITWRLAVPIPGDWFQQVKVAAG